MENESNDALYSAFKSKDRRFDGHFFVGVTSTGIYCRPVCTARMPKKENCVFFQTAAAAEKAGFRPCLTCRPELAPGMSLVDAKTTLAGKSAKYIEENCGDSSSLQTLSAKLGYTDRHLRRVFVDEFHVSPVEYMQTCRLLLAKGLLTDTDLKIIDIAMASGFGSLRRFNDLFRKRYRLSPTGFRSQTKRGKMPSSFITITLGYRPPYEWDRLLRFLALRAIPGVEVIIDNTYNRTVKIENQRQVSSIGWISVSNLPEKHALAIAISEGLLPVLPQLLGRIRSLFDLNSEPALIFESLSGINSFIPDVYTEGIRVPGCIDPFELCVRAILGQQITVKAAGTLSGRLAAAFGKPLLSDISGLSYTFPTAKDILSIDGSIENNLGPLGIIASRARAIQSLAQMIYNGQIDFELCENTEVAMKKLTEIPGIGQWTAKYIAMRALGATDILPETDLGIRKALSNKTPKEILALAEVWKPWRSYATMALWDSLH